MHHRSPSALALLVCLSPLAAACGGSNPPATSGANATASASATMATTAPPPAPAPTATPAAEPTKEEAHKLVMLGASCWFGGLWADAEGQAAAGEDRKALVDARCHDVVRHVYGDDANDKVERFRAFEAKEMGDFVAKVETTAASDSVDGARKDKLSSLAKALIEAQREAMHARRAADKLRRDEEKAAEREKLSDDEVKAVAPMRTHAALDALLALDAGDLSKEANALGVLAVMERVNIARGLPKHLKMYAWGDGLNALFGVKVPDMPNDATKKLPKGLLLSYLMDVSKAAGHPVPEKVATSPDAKGKYALAYAGMLEGIADKLRADEPGIEPTTELQKVVATVKNRLEAEYNAEKNARAGAVPPAPPPKKK